MTPNVGGIDKLVRYLIGVALLALCFVLEGPARWWGLLGLVPLLTARFGFCPLYTLLGVNTCGKKD